MKWHNFDGSTVPPAFHDRDIVEVEYRDGRRRTGELPWMFSGWIHYSNGNDIVKYRLVGKTPKG